MHEKMAALHFKVENLSKVVACLANNVQDLGGKLDTTGHGTSLTIEQKV